MKRILLALVALLACGASYGQAYSVFKPGGNLTGTWNSQTVGEYLVNAQTGTTYTLALSDVNSLVTMNNAAANTLTIPTNASVAFPIGTIVRVQQIGAGVTTVSPAGGVTITNAAGITFKGGPATTSFLIGFRYGHVTFKKTGTDTWDITEYFNGTLLLNNFSDVSCTPNAYCPQIVAAGGAASWLSLGAGRGSSPVLGRAYVNYFGLNGTGDMLWETTGNNDQFTMSFPSGGGLSGIYMKNDTGNGLQLTVNGSADPSGSCGYGATFYPFVPSWKGCSVLDTNSGGAGFLLVLDNAVANMFLTQNSEMHWAGYSATPVIWEDIESAATTDAQVTLGDSTQGTSTLALKGPTRASVTVNGVPVGGSYTGTTGAIGGGALVAGACTSGTVAVGSSTTAMAVIASPVTYPGDGIFWHGYVSAAGTVTVKVCASVAATPIASNYNVRVFP